jgi:hypothetical protein
LRDIFFDSRLGLLLLFVDSSCDPFYILIFILQMIV